MKNILISCQIPKICILAAFFWDSQMANLWIKDFSKWYQKYHSQNILIHPCFGTNMLATATSN